MTNNYFALRLNAVLQSISVNPKLAIGSYSRFLIFITSIVSGSCDDDDDVERKWNNKLMLTS